MKRRQLSVSDAGIRRRWSTFPGVTTVVDQCRPEVNGSTVTAAEVIKDMAAGSEIARRKRSQMSVMRPLRLFSEIFDLG